MEAKDFLYIDSEAKFMAELLATLNVNDNDNFKMIKSKNKYCSLDFILLNEYNLQNLFIEHKKKNIDASKYDTLFIGYDKLIKIDTFYHSSNTLLVWECKNAIYFTMFDKSFLKNNTKYVNGSKCFEIDKSICGIGIQKLNLLILDKLVM